MKSDIIYKIGTAEFRKRYIDPDTVGPGEAIITIENQ